MHHPSQPSASESATQLHNDVLTFLQQHFSEGVNASHIDYDFPVFELSQNVLHDALAALKTEKGFTFLTTMCGAHFPENTGSEFALIYQLHNLQQNLRIRIKCFFSSKDLTAQSVTDIWKAANWMEREAFDFYGFKFTGHPDLRRILNMDEMNYHPLRKEYGLEDAGRDDKADKYFGR